MEKDKLIEKMLTEKGDVDNTIDLDAYARGLIDMYDKLVRDVILGLLHNRGRQNKIMTYEDFLFSQLFMNHIQNNKTQYQELEYDLIFPKMIKHKNIFLASNYNVDTSSEYDCIVGYLIHEVR